jgi:hypothetical protein
LAGPILLDRYYGWANGWVIDWPSQKFGPAIIGPAKFFLNFGWAIFGWAKIGCGWPSQMGFSPTLVLSNLLTLINAFKKELTLKTFRVCMLLNILNCTLYYSYNHFLI